MRRDAPPIAASLKRIAVVAMVAGVLAAWTVAAVAYQARGLASAGSSERADVNLRPLSERSVVLAADGSQLTVLHAEENRVHVPLERIPRHTVDAVLVIEDEDFFAHDGVNLRAAARALFTNVSAGDVRQGGSTITQQLVKNLLLTPEKDLDRKVREAVLALQLEDQMSKDEILERYLNTVYFGNGAYGVQAAAEVYWGIDAEDLGLAESALLAGIIRNPVGYDPIANPDVAEERRALVVDRLFELGHLTPQQVEDIAREPLPTARHQAERGPGDYFVEEVKRRLLADPRLGATPQERYNAVFKGGLRIHTTLDPNLQRLARQAVDEQLPDTGGEFTAALVSLDPHTGAVRALVGGPDFDKAKYNIATQGIGRQPGSSFKPFVLAAALEDGHSPNDRILGGGPCRFRPSDRYPWIIEPWEVDNYGGARAGVVSLEAATHRSLNCAYARLVMLLGPEKVVDVARRMGITTPLDEVPAIALGVEEVRPLDMASAYGTFAADGVHHEPYLIEEVRDREGDLLFEARTEGTRAIPVEVARQVTAVLQGVVSRGTGTRAGFDGQDLAGKTGTTQNWEDAWFVGFSPHLSTAVWMGSPVGKVSMRNVGGIRVTGGSYPARIWRAFMEPAHVLAPEVGFARPDPADRGSYLQVQGERSYRPRARRSTVATTTTTRPQRTEDDTDTTPTTAAPDSETHETDPSSGDGRGGGDGGGNGGDGGGEPASG